MSQSGSIGNGGGGDITFPIDVPHGGTGDIYLNPHTVLIGEGINAVAFAGPGNTNTILFGQGPNDDPIFGSLIAGSNITLTNGPGTITISSTGGGGGGEITFTDDSGSTATTAASMVNLFGTSGQGITVIGDNLQTIRVSALDATTSQKGVTSLATNAETLTGTSTTKVITPNDLTVKLGVQTAHGVMLGEGLTSPLSATAAGAVNTVLLGQGPASDPVFGTVPNGALQNSTITLNNGNNITVTGSPISLGGAATIAVTGTTTHAVQVGNASGSLTSIGVGTNGQVLLGATGADPAFGTLTSSDGSITFTVGINSLSLQVNGSGFGKTITGNTGGAQSPVANNWNLFGNAGQGVSTSGSGGTITITVATASTSQIGVTTLATNALTIAGASLTTVNTPASLNAKLGPQTIHGVMLGEGSTAALNATAAGTNGQVLIGATGADPAFGTIGSSGGTITITGGTNTVNIDVSGIVGKTITGDSGGPLVPTAGNWNVLGQQAGTIPVVDTIGSGSTLKIEDRTWQTKFVVDASATVGLRGTYTTIQSAINAASAGDSIFIRPGTYTEDLTLKSLVNLTTSSRANGVTGVEIIGKATLSTAGSLSISNINLTTNSDYLLVISGSSASAVSFNNCFLNCSNHTGINFTSSSSGCAIYLDNCEAVLLTTGITLYTMTSPGIINFRYCDISNIGSTTTPSTNTTGIVYLNYSYITFPVSCTSTGGFSLNYSTIFCENINTTGISLSGTSFANCDTSNISGGSATAISVGAGTTCNLYNCNVASSNTNAISGSGTLKYNPITFPNTSSTISTTTQTVLSYGPRIQFGGAGGGCQILSGSGSPSGVVTAPKNSLYMRSDATTVITRLYVNTDGGTTWAHFTASA